MVVGILNVIMVLILNTLKRKEMLMIIPTAYLKISHQQTLKRK